MNSVTGLRFVLAAAVLAVAAVAFTTFERPSPITVQRGYRGTGMDLLYNPRLVEARTALQTLPEVVEAAEPDPDGPRAGEVYQNVQVLGNLSAGQFGRVMQAMTNWVSPEETVANGGCAYCHNLQNMAADSVYTKVVARRMLQMVREINGEWASHVQQTGVTCYTCHRGQPVPANYWTAEPAPEAGSRAGGVMAEPQARPTGVQVAGISSLPTDAFTPFLLEDGQIRVASRVPLPDGNRQSIRQTEWTYSLMMHFSQALGANCTLCHNSRNFSGWEESTPQRVNAWYGIRMVRDVNANYIQPLAPVFPANRLGPAGDPFKVNCTTCHQGVNRPLNGASMLQDYPELNLITLQPTTTNPHAGEPPPE